MILEFTLNLKKMFLDNVITLDEYKNDAENITYEKISKFEILIEPYITALESGLRDNEQIIEHLIKMFEKLIKFGDFLDNKNYVVQTGMKDHFNFFIYELFLYTVVIFKYHMKPELLFEFLNTNFFGLRTSVDKKYSDFLGFNKFLPSLELRGKKSNLNIFSLQADLIVNRAEKTKFKAKLLVEADLYLAYYSEIKNSYDRINFWFPRLYTYYPIFEIVNIFKKLASKRDLNRFLIELGMKDKQELEKNIEQYQLDYKKKGKHDRWYNSSISGVPLLTDVLKIDQLGIID